jgi:hypothetical protein
MYVIVAPSCIPSSMSMRPRKIPAPIEKTDMFSTSGVLDFKSGVVFESPVVGLEASQNASEIRQCVTDTMLKAVEPTAKMIQPSGLSGQDIEKTVREAVAKHLESQRSVPSAPMTEASIHDTIRSIAQKHLASLPKVTARRDVEATFTRSDVEKAVRSALSQHIPLPETSTQNFSRSAVENAVRSALREQMSGPATSGLATSARRSTGDQYDRIHTAVRNAVEKNFARTDGVPTSSARGNNMREMLY